MHKSVVVALAVCLLVAVPLAAQTPCDWTAGTDKITENCGSVGIGIDATSAPANVLDVRTSGVGFISLGTSDASKYLLLYNGGASDQEAIAWPSGQDMRLGTTTSITGTGFVERMRIKSSGKIGIGTTSPANLLDIRGSSAQAMSIGTAETSPLHFLWLYNGGAADGEAVGWTAGDDLRFGTSTNVNTGGWAEKARMTSSGSLGLGTTAPAEKLHVVGNIFATGNIYANGSVRATYQDLAEWVPAAGELAPGTVVVLNRNASNEVIASSQPYDTAVAGVVSPQPGIILGEEGEDKAQIATTGRVRIHVDATQRPIRVGDLLVTSSTPGAAMASEPVMMNGIAMHRPGTVIGKALEPLASGKGEILVLLSLQ